MIVSRTTFIFCAQTLVGEFHRENNFLLKTFFYFVKNYNLKHYTKLNVLNVYTWVKNLIYLSTEISSHVIVSRVIFETKNRFGSIIRYHGMNITQSEFYLPVYLSFILLGSLLFLTAVLKTQVLIRKQFFPLSLYYS